MYLDFYMRTQDDPNFVPGQFQVSNLTEALVEQIKMSLLTSKGEVMGDPNFGFGAYDYLFDTHTANTAAITASADTQIQSYVTLSQNISVTTAAIVYQVEKYRNAIGLDVQIGDLGKFGILFD
jgi:hypothetical protein